MMLIPFKSFPVLLMIIISSSCQDTLYGMRMPMVSVTGPSGATGTTGSSSTGISSPGASGPTSRGRVVGNSILDLDDWDTEMENESMRGLQQRQPSGYSQPMTRPILTGPSVVSGKMLVTDSGAGVRSSMSMEERSREMNPTRPMGSIGGSVNDNGMQDRKVYRYVSVHVPPPEPIVQRTTPKSPTPAPETHYQIVFIKAPSVVPQEEQIQLPEPPRLKTLVYVLLKKPDMNDFVRVSQRKVKPAKPQVFFIRYKGDKSQPGSMMMMNTAGNNNENGNTDPGNSIPVSRPRGISTSTTSRPIGPTTTGGMGLMMQNLGGYENPEIADSDFSHDSFNENEYLRSSFQRHNINQQQLRSGLSYAPTASSHYGIVS